MVFFGEYQVSFTAPGRLVLPKKVRELLKGNTFVLAKGYDNSLSGYDRQDWEERTQSLLSQSVLDKSDIDKKRFFFGSTVYMEIDDQGRFVIPKNLLQYANLTNGKAVVVGVGDHFEIWEISKWEKYIKEVKS